MWYVYLLRCYDGLLYTGITINPKRRVNEHNSRESNFTKGRTPVEMVYLENQSNRSTAAKREKEIKGWRREKKLKLIRVLP